MNSKFTVSVIAATQNDSEAIVKEFVTESFTEAIEHYSEAVRYFRSEILWGPEVISADIMFFVGNEPTERTEVRLSSTTGGEMIKQIPM
jgi:hypothetical protein